MFQVFLSGLMIAVGLLAVNATDSYALPSMFAQCTSCHVDDTPTCSGCHPMIANSLIASTHRTQYLPGETVTVQLESEAFNWPGWVRAILYDENMSEVDRVTGPTGTGDDGSGDISLQLPVLLSAPAPLTPGFYTWTVVWFGSGGTGGSEFPHMETPITVNQFEVSETIPSTTTTTTITVQTTTTTTTTTTTITVQTTTTTTTTTAPPTTTTSTVPVSTTTTTTLPPPPLDHYRLYTADGPDGPPVDLVDQFQSQSVNLNPATFFMPPVSKNGEPILDTFTHQTCYGMFGGSFSGSVEVDNQFGVQTLSVGNPVAVCVPSEKLEPPMSGFLQRDHLKCYQASGSAPQVTAVELADQFQTQAGVDVLAPFLYCTPVDKNGEGITTPDEHLTCYNTTVGSSVGLVPVRNQFHPEQGNVIVFDASGLCVPSQQLSGSTTTTTGLPTTTTTVATTTTTVIGQTTTTVTPTTTTTVIGQTTTTVTPTTTTTTLPASENLIPTRIGLLRFGGSPPAGRLFKIVSKTSDPLLFALPPPNGSTDPENTGGTVRVEMGGKELECTLGPGAFNGVTGWKKLGNPRGSKGYKYLNKAAPDNDPCKVVLLKQKVIKIIARATGELDVPVGYPPGNPDFGTVLTLGEGPRFRYCALAKARHSRESEGRLVKAKDQPPPAECPPEVPTTTTTTPSTTTTAPSSTVTTSTTVAPTTTTTVIGQTTTTVTPTTTTTVIGQTTTTVTPTTTTTTTTIAPNQPPTVTAGASTTRGPIALAVDFTAAAADPDGLITSIDWDFGDETVGSGASVSHSYDSTGIFRAVVTVTDNDGATASAGVTITALPTVVASVNQAYPTRLAEGPAGNFYVTDAVLGSVFVYDNALNPVSEIGGLDKPLGVAVDALGKVYVGNDGRDNVEVYDGGILDSVIDNGGIQMPNDIAIDDVSGNVYVVDSLSDTVRAYNAGGTWLTNIGFPGEGNGSLVFPAALTIAYGPTTELLVADQGRSQVQVFDLTGIFQRTLGGPVGAFSPDWQGLFVRLQSLAVDGAGALHAADSHACRVQMIDPVTGAFQGSYGDYGAGPGELDLPLDVLITGAEQALIADAENGRVQLLSWQVP